MANRGITRQLEERVRPSLVGMNVGRAQLFHIGSSSEATRESDYQSVRSRSTVTSSSTAQGGGASFNKRKPISAYKRDWFL